MRSSEGAADLLAQAGTAGTGDDNVEIFARTSGSKITVITADDPPCVTKRFRLTGEGALDKRTVAYVTAGTMHVAEVSTLAELADMLCALRPNQALAYGVPTSAPVALVSEEAWARAGRPEGKLPRTRKTMRWPAGPGVMMLDYDPFDVALDRDALVAAIRTAAPGLVDVAMLWWPSTSSCIFNGEHELRGVRGQRLYLLVQDAADIPRAGKALEAALWAAGHGRYVVSTSGSLLARTLVDVTVWQPERIDFAAGALCDAPLEQHRGHPVRIDGTIECVDTAAALPDADAATATAVQAARTAARAAVADEAARARATWIEERVEAIVARIRPAAGEIEHVRERAREASVRAVDRGELLGDWTITVLDSAGRHDVAVAALLDNPARYHGAPTLDPVEPEYDGGRPTGKLFLYGARPMLHSFAHGGTSYKLMRQPGRTELVRGKEHEVTLSVLERLRAAPEVYDFGTELVVVDGGRPYALNAEVLRHHLGGLTQFWRWHKLPDGSAVQVLENPPLTVAKAIIGMGSRRRLKALSAVITAPTLRPNGTVLNTPGFDAATGLLLELDELPVEIPARPTLDQAREALARLWRPFDRFPFAEPIDRGVMLAAVITAVVRPALPTAPAFGFDAPVQGSGKTLLGKCLAVLATGEAPTLLAHTDTRHGDEEVRKRIFAVLREGARAVLWDNVIGVFDSASLAAALTAERITDRVLGVSATSSVPNRALFALTGNNLTMAGDMPRRVLRCRIDPQSETPFAREFDLDPLAHCIAHRQALAAAALVLVRSWLTSGQARAPGRTASFEEWDDIVRQTVVWCIGMLRFDGADPMEAIAAATAADPERDSWHELLLAWGAVFGDKTVTARQVLDAAYGITGNAELAAGLAEFAPPGRGLTAKSLGRTLMFRKDRIVAGMKIVQSDLYQGTARWRLVGFGGSGGFSYPTHEESQPVSTYMGETNPPERPNQHDGNVVVTL